MAEHQDDCEAAVARLERHVNARYASRADWVRSLRSDLADLSYALPPPPPGDSRIERLTADAPRLAPAVARLDDDHERIRADIDAVVERLPDARRSTVAELVRELAGDVDRYLSGVSDLIYEAYDVDIGGED